MKIKSSVGYTTYNQRRYYKRKSDLVIGVKEDLIKVKGVVLLTKWKELTDLQFSIKFNCDERNFTVSHKEHGAR